MKRQMMMADDSCGPLVQAVDAAIDQAMAAFQAGQSQQGMALLTAADVAMDSLLQAMGMADPDEDQQGGSMQPMAPMGGMNSAPVPGEVRSERATWDTAYVNDLPDSAFLYIESGGKKDGAGKTTPRSLRHFPYRDASGKVDMPHLRNALSRIPQSSLPSSVKDSLTTKAQGLMKAQGADMNAADESGWAIRDFAFQMEAASDGLTLEGYAAVFNQPTRISGWEGDFEEQVAPGAFARTLRERTPVLMFNHGKHPLIGDMPLGVIKRAVEDSKGVYISARLSDNWLIQPVRDAVRDGAVTGMSFRFAVPKGGDAWLDRKGALRLRTLKDIDVPELGPVVFPAYQPTTAMVRSALDCIDCELTGRPVARSAGGGDSTGTAPGNGDRPPSLSVERVRAHRDLLFRGIIRA